MMTGRDKMTRARFDGVPTEFAGRRIPGGRPCERFASARARELVQSGSDPFSVSDGELASSG